MPFKHVLLLIFINALWGYNFVAGKIGTEEFGPLLFITLRFVVVLILLAWCLRWVEGQMHRIFAIGFCMGLGHYGFMFYGIYIAGSLSAVAVASQLTVPFATILAVVFLKERIAWMRIFAIALSFAGTVVIGFEPIGIEHVLALTLTAVASLAMASVTLLMRSLQGVGTFNLQAWIALCSVLSVGILALVFENPTWQQVVNKELSDYWLVVYSAIGATIVGHGLLYWLLQRYSVTNIAPFITLSTIFAMLFSVLLLDEVLTLKILIGGAITLVGVTVVAVRNAKEKAPSGPSAL